MSEAQQIADIVCISNHNYPLYQASFLPESHTLWYLPRRKGINADLRLGARTITGELKTHAWVEYNNVVLNDEEDINQIYEPFDINQISPKI